MFALPQIQNYPTPEIFVSPVILDNFILTEDLQQILSENNDPLILET